MKSFVVVLLCALAAAQGRSTRVAVANPRTVAALGENPWVVHLRMSVWSSGLLETCAGALIDPTWILTSAQCVHDARFIWARFAAVEVISPELVLETSAVTRHQGWDQLNQLNDIALVALNSVVQNSENIAVIPIPPAGSPVGNTAKFCAYGQTEDRNPGEQLTCTNVQVLSFFNVLATTAPGLAASTYDTGAALVSDGMHRGIFIQAGDQDTAMFMRTDAYTGWIVQNTGIQV